MSGGAAITGFTIGSELLAAAQATPPVGAGSNAAPHLVEDYQVLQRGADDRASCLIQVPDHLKAFSDFHIQITDEGGKIWLDRDVKPRDAGGRSSILVEAIPTGGPYTVEASATKGKDKNTDRILFHKVLVGDIWILAGQSNMFGAATPEERLLALPYVNMLNLKHLEMDSHWCAGIPPMHRMPDRLAPNVLKQLNPGITDERIKEILAVKTPVGRIGPSYFFAQELNRLGSDVPIGFIPAAIGSALANWDPVNRAKNRYGFLSHHVNRAGGRVKGLLWYQGEQDAIFGDETNIVNKPGLIYPISTYGIEFKKFVQALRDDFKNPDMVVIVAQICRHHQALKERNVGWERVRDLQRLIPELLSNSHVVPTVDLDLNDGLHLDYQAQKRLGKRMAQVALSHVKKGAPSRTEIKLKSVRFVDARGTIAVEFDGVVGKLQAPGKPTGFQLRDTKTGDDLNWIFRADFVPDRPNVVLVRSNRLPPDPVGLVYGAGATPYVNIVDESDMGVPAFGPVEVKRSA